MPPKRQPNATARAISLRAPLDELMTLRSEAQREGLPGREPRREAAVRGCSVGPAREPAPRI